ncbi:MAG: hypothetical protein ACI9TY_000792 [Alphaproteobacteria bacterium]|jgi:hypothetical protein
MTIFIIVSLVILAVIGIQLMHISNAIAKNHQRLLDESKRQTWILEKSFALSHPELSKEYHALKEAQLKQNLEYDERHLRTC